MILGTVMYVVGVIQVFVGGVMAVDAKRDDSLALGLWAAAGIAAGLFMILAGGNWGAWA